MNEHNDRREEKLDSREIRFRAPQSAAERPHGKLYRWFDNFWYHYKWQTIAAAFLAVVVLVCSLQMCNKESEGDLSVVLAGPYSFIADEASYKALNACLTTYLASDVDGNGEKKITTVNFSFYSEAEIKELEGRVDEDGKPAGQKVDGYVNTQQYQQYSSYIKTGDASVYFLSPYLFEELSTKSSMLTDLNGVFDTLPAGAVVTTDEDGNEHCFGVRLGDTALYRDNVAVQVLPADTVICLMGPFIFGNSSNDNVYAAAVAYFKALAE